MSPVSEGHRHCKNHCSVCGSHFTSLAAFDLHRSGSYKKGRRCREPGAVIRKGAPALIAAELHGSCEIYPPYENDCEIWGVV